MSPQDSVPRGRHAPPLEIRQGRQRQRLFAAAATVFARCGYAESTAEGIAREAGMSKATFYEHFVNKEACIVALFDAALETILRAIGHGDNQAGTGDPRARYRRNVRAFLDAVEANPEVSQTLLVEIIGAGPRAVERRDFAFGGMATYVFERNAADAAAGLAPKFASPDDAYAVVGAIVELAARRLRTGVPEDIHDLEPVIDRFISGLLAAGEPAGTRSQAA